MSASPAQPFYDHERTTRRPAPDWGGDELFGATPRRRFARAPLEELDAPLEELDDPSEDGSPAELVVVTPGRPTHTSAPVRHRQSRIEQRIHARPDRLAAWAFALCVFLIVVALATSV
jgi:hypothetical protein